MDRKALQNPQELKFPVEWEFRVMFESTAEEGVRAALETLLAADGFDPAVKDGLNSSTGKYRTLKFAVELSSREMMNDFSARIAAIPGVKFVL